MRFSAPQRGWVITSEGILVTSDGGRSWRPHLIEQLRERFVSVDTVAFPNQRICGLLCSYVSREKRFLLSEDNGNSWRETARFFAERGNFIWEDLAFADQLHGCIVLVEGLEGWCRTGFHTTTDGGRTWVRSNLTVQGRAQSLLLLNDLRGVLAVSKLNH